MSDGLEFTLIDLTTRTGWLTLFGLGVAIGYGAVFYWSTFGPWVAFFLGLIVGVFIAAYALASLYNLNWEDLEVSE
jgi:fructose-specific phosphotransferase system IIC component